MTFNSEHPTCIFCKEDSSSSKSVEHIIPESLGGKDIILPIGIVCDKCNNYFSREIEAPVLNDSYFKSLRFIMDIPNKKRVIPVLPGIAWPHGIQISLDKNSNDGMSLSATNQNDESKFIKYLQNHKTGKIILPIPTIEDDKQVMSRFLCKIALEYLALRLYSIPGWQQEVTFKRELDDLRNFVRRGRQNYTWAFSRRRIYDANRKFHESPDVFEVLNELDLLYINQKYLYMVVCIFGVEYVVNMSHGDPDSLHTYNDWLSKNDYVSPLYMSKNR